MNKTTKRIGLLSLGNGDFETISPFYILVGKGCLRGVCVGDFVTINDYYPKGAMVISVGRRIGRLGIKSLGNGDIKNLDPLYIQIARESPQYSNDARSVD